jgi:ATP-dependent Lon protease
LLVRYKLYSARHSAEKNAVITPDDVETVLGKPAAQRGNFPSEPYPGLSRALAVTGDNCGMSFAVETMLIPDEESLTITGLPRESTVDSVKLAISYIKCRFPGSLADRGIHVHFGEGAVVKDGPSAGLAILMSLLSAVLNTPISESESFTGEINGNGYVFNIGGTIAKINAAEQSGYTRVYIPYGNYIELSNDAIKQFALDIVPVRHVSEVIDLVFPDKNKYDKVIMLR